jgi:nitroreductase
MIKTKILPQIKNRYSPRKFFDKEIEKQKIKLILESARLAPSGFNNQPWRYILVDKKSKNRKKLESSLMLGNGWANSAPMLIVCFTHKKFQKSLHKIPYRIYDSALSVMSLVIEAEHQGLKAHQMSGFYPEKVKKALNIPEDFDVLVVIALGYEDKELKGFQKIKNNIVNKIINSRQRKEIKEIVFVDNYRE